MFKGGDLDATQNSDAMSNRSTQKQTGMLGGDELHAGDLHDLNGTSIKACPCIT